MMAVPLLAASFQAQLCGSLAILAIDNQGVVGGLVRGASVAPDHNAAVAKIWLDFAAESVSPWIIRVETKCNIADGPTRGDLHHLSLMEAHWVPPRWPEWIQDIWAME